MLSDKGMVLLQPGNWEYEFLAVYGLGLPQTQMTQWAWITVSLSLISVSNNGLVSDNNSLGNPQLLFSNLNINASLSLTIPSSELVLVFIIHQGSEH